MSKWTAAESGSQPKLAVLCFQLTVDIDVLGTEPGLFQAEGFCFFVEAFGQKVCVE